VTSEAKEPSWSTIVLVDHRVDGVLQLQDLPLHRHRDLLGEVAVGHRGRHLGDIAHLPGEVTGHAVDAVGEVLPDAPHPLNLGLAAQLPLGTDLPRDARHFRGEGVELVDHRVDRVLELEDLPLHVHGDRLREVAVGHRGGDFGDIAHLPRQVAGHAVDAIGEILPDAADAAHLGLPAEPPLRPHLPCDARHLRGEGVQLVDHRVDGVLQLQDLAAHVHRDLLRQVAVGHRGRHLRDVAHLRGEVAGHAVDAVGEVFPRPGDAPDLSLAAELPLGADLAGHAGDLRGEGAELVDHRVDRLADAEEFAPDRVAVLFQRDALGEVALGDGPDDAGDLLGGPDQVADQVVHRLDPRRPPAGRGADVRPLRDPALLADDVGDPLGLHGAVFQQVGQVVEGVGDRRPDDALFEREADAEVPFFQGLERFEEAPAVVNDVGRRRGSGLPVPVGVSGLLRVLVGGGRRGFFGQGGVLRCVRRGKSLWNPGRTGGRASGSVTCQGRQPGGGGLGQPRAMIAETGRPLPLSVA